MVVFPLCRWCPPQETSQPHPPPNFFRGNINIYLHFMSSLHIDMTQVLKNPSSKTMTYIFYIVTIMTTDVLEMKGASVSATMILTKLKRDNSVPAHKGLTYQSITFRCCQSLAMNIINHIRGNDTTNLNEVMIKFYRQISNIRRTFAGN